jgi:hypothetical protein
MTETIRVDASPLDRAGQPIPTEITIETARRVTELRMAGASFAFVALRVPETLSPSGAHDAYVAALRHFTARHAHRNRHPFDGQKHAPAWTPTRSSLADKLRPTDRP